MDYSDDHVHRRCCCKHTRHCKHNHKADVSDVKRRNDSACRTRPRDDHKYPHATRQMPNDSVSIGCARSKTQLTPTAQRVSPDQTVSARVSQNRRCLLGTVPHLLCSPPDTMTSPIPRLIETSPVPVITSLRFQFAFHRRTRPSHPTPASHPFHSRSTSGCDVYFACCHASLYLCLSIFPCICRHVRHVPFSSLRW